jgi:hypothetical protein
MRCLGTAGGVDYHVRRTIVIVEEHMIKNDTDSSCDRSDRARPLVPAFLAAGGQPAEAPGAARASLCVMEIVWSVPFLRPMSVRGRSCYGVTDEELQGSTQPLLQRRSRDSNTAFYCSWSFKRATLPPNYPLGQVNMWCHWVLIAMLWHYKEDRSIPRNTPFLSRQSSESRFKFTEVDSYTSQVKTMKL